MSAPENMNGGTEARRRAAAFMGNLIALLGLLVVGDALALAPVTLKTTVVCWMLVVVAIVQFIFGRHFQPAESATIMRTIPIRPRAFGRHRSS